MLQVVQCVVSNHHSHSWKEERVASILHFPFVLRGPMHGSTIWVLSVTVGRKTVSARGGLVLARNDLVCGIPSGNS